MTPQIGFFGFFGATLVALIVVFWSGHHGRLRLHIPAVIGTVALLGTTIYFAERLGHHYDLAATGRIYPVHLFLAKLATASYLLPLLSGIITLRRPPFRPVHRGLAILTLLLTVAAAGTGTLMLWRAQPLEGASSAITQ